MSSNELKLLCVDDTNKPFEIPTNKWVKKGEWYHPSRIFVHVEQGYIQGVEVEEIELDESNHPYESYKLTRFACPMTLFPLLIKLVRDCSELNGTTEELKDIFEKEIIKQVEQIPELN